MKKVRRRQKSEFWTKEDPEYKLAIRPPTRHVGKTLISMLEKEEIPNVRIYLVFKNLWIIFFTFPKLYIEIGVNFSPSVLISI